MVQHRMFRVTCAPAYMVLMVFSAAAAPLEFLILDLTPASHIDSSGCHTLGIEFAQRLRKLCGIQVVLAGPNSKVLRNLDRTGVLDEVGREWVFSNVADAFDACVSLPKVVVDSAGSSSSNDSQDGQKTHDLELHLGKDAHALKA